MLQVCNTCPPVLWSTLDAPSQDQILQIGNDNVALLMQGIHCFSARNDPPISLGHDLCGDSPVHQPCDGDGFSFSPTSPDDSRPNSSSMSTSTSSWQVHSILQGCFILGKLLRRIRRLLSRWRQWWSSTTYFAFKVDSAIFPFNLLLCFIVYLLIYQQHL